MNLAGAGIMVMQVAPAFAADVDVAITGIKSSDGRMMCRIFGEGAGFPIRGASQTVHAAIADGSSRCRFGDLPAGQYAVAVLHDTNVNGKLDKNFLGFPTEGLAFSQNVRPRIGVPSFSSAAFKLGPEGARLALRMTYP